MKKSIYYLSFLALLAVGCQKNKPKDMGIKSNGLPKVETTDTNQSNLPIAYVEIDSISNRYQYCIDEQTKLRNKQINLQKQLASDAQRLQAAMGSFQEKLQTGKFKTQQEAEAAQMALQRQKQAIDKKQESAELEMSKLTIAYQKDLRKRLNDYLAATYKDKYALILTNSETAVNVVYASPSLDITAEVVEGLNKEYKK